MPLKATPGFEQMARDYQGEPRRFWQLVKHQYKTDEYRLAYTPPEMDGVEFEQNAVAWLAEAFPYCLLHYLHPRIVQYEAALGEDEGGLQLGAAVKEVNNCAKGRKATGFVLSIPNLRLLLNTRRGLETGRALIASLFSHFKVVRVQRRGCSVYILALNDETVQIQLQPCEQLSVAVVVDKVRVTALFENSDIAPWEDG